MPMISTQAKAVKNALFKNRNLDYLLNVPLKIQRKDWEDSTINTILPERINVEKIAYENILGEWITNKTSDKQKIILYFHGGGLCQGSCITHRKLVSHIVRITKMSVFIHDYPLAPENPYPAALNYSEKVYFWLLENGYESENIIFGGDSSGCGLALALMMRLRDKSFLLPRAVFLLSPMLDFSLSSSTIKTLVELDPTVFEEDLKMCSKYYCNNESLQDPYISPIFGEYHGFPPILIQVGSEEILLDDSNRLYHKLKVAGVNVQLDIWDGMWHVFQGWIGEIPEADQSLEKINQFLEGIY